MNRRQFLSLLPAFPGLGLLPAGAGNARASVLIQRSALAVSLELTGTLRYCYGKGEPSDNNNSPLNQQNQAAQADVKGTSSSSQGSSCELDKRVRADMVNADAGEDMRVKRGIPAKAVPVTGRALPPRVSRSAERFHVT